MILRHQDLKTTQEEGKFRQDLFYRLSIFSLRTPALREKRDDIPLLTDFFLSQFRNELKLIQETLLKVKGNMTKAVKMLNITYDTLRYRIKKFDIMH
jgi:DNA-binding NtrC family response regulator